MHEFSYEGTQEFLVLCANEFISSFKGKDVLQLSNLDNNRYYSDNYPFPNTAILSHKQDNVYSISRIYNDIFIKTEIIYPLELRKMSSDFWENFIELDRLGKVRFLSGHVNDMVQHKNNQKDARSVIYNIIKEQVLLDEYQGNYVYFGSIEVCFDLNESNENLIENIVESLRILHKINYQLYRKNYLKTRNK